MLAVIEWILRNIPVWAIALAFSFAALSVATAITGYYVKQSQTAQVASAASAAAAEMAERGGKLALVAKLNGEKLKHLFGRVIIDTDGRTWIHADTEIARFQSLDLSRWPELLAERDALIAQLSAVPPNPAHGANVDTAVPPKLHNAFIDFRSKVMLASSI